MNVKTFFSSMFFAFCFLCILSIGTSAQVARPVVSRSSTYVDNNYAYKLTEKDFENTPSWNPNESDPPISVIRAVKIARENLPRFVKSSETWKMRMVTLMSMGEDKWYYRIYFYCFGMVCREIEDRSFTAIVKMDGTIVEPKKVTIEN